MRIRKDQLSNPAYVREFEEWRLRAGWTEPDVIVMFDLPSDERWWEIIRKAKEAAHA